MADNHVFPVTAMSIRIFANQRMGHRSRCPIVDLGNGLLLVIADAAADIADLGYEAHLRNRRLVGTWPRKHIADLGNLTFRLLIAA